MDYKCLLLILAICAVKGQAATLEQEVGNSTKFTLDWYKTSFNADVNTVVSPISFRILLSLLYHSTIGETERELQENVYFSGKEETAASQALTLNTLIENPNMKVVNRIYIKEGHELKQSLNARALDYHSSFEYKDFTKSEQTANEINHFVEEQTNGLIKNLVSPNIFNEDTRILLLNTLYFKADWASQFKENSVSKLDFTGIDRYTYSIDFMNREDNFMLHYNDELHAWTLKLDYVSESNSQFVIILPDEDKTIHDVKNNLNSETFNSILNNNELKYRRIFMPKFEIESDIDGVRELRKLGLNSMFDKSEIDALTIGPKLSVSDVKQKAKIIVDTQGTEAAAATYIVMIEATSAHFGPPVERFYVNRPFIYLIMNNETKEPLFIGHYSKPDTKYVKVYPL